MHAFTDTTDVQTVRVEETDNLGSVIVICSFISGTDASGCKVEFVGELTNTSVNFTRENDERESVISFTLPFHLSCYFQVLGFDLEHDGSTGTLSVPGMIVRVFSEGDCSYSNSVGTVDKSKRR